MSGEKERVYHNRVCYIVLVVVVVVTGGEGGGVGKLLGVVSRPNPIGLVSNEEEVVVSEEVEGDLCPPPP